jgi:hypothetical protein
MRELMKISPTRSNDKEKLLRHKVYFINSFIYIYIYIYIYTSYICNIIYKIQSNTTAYRSVDYSDMFRLTKSSSGWVKKHENFFSFTKIFMVLYPAWWWLCKSKHFAVIYTPIRSCVWLNFIYYITYIYRVFNLKMDR